MSVYNHKNVFGKLTYGIECPRASEAPRLVVETSDDVYDSVNGGCRVIDAHLGQFPLRNCPLVSNRIQNLLEQFLIVFLKLRFLNYCNNFNNMFSYVQRLSSLTFNFINIANRQLEKNQWTNETEKTIWLCEKTGSMDNFFISLGNLKNHSSFKTRSLSCFFAPSTLSYLENAFFANEVELNWKIAHKTKSVHKSIIMYTCTFCSH